MVLVALALAAMPTAAHAATASVVECPGDRSCSAHVVFEAAPGEVNHVTAVDDDQNGIVLRDAAAPITAGRRCTSLGPNEVRCPRAFGEYAYMRLGDRDDTLRFTPRPDPNPAIGTLSGINVYGSAGRDVLDGGDGPDYLEGGSGDDVLRAAGGNDQLRGDWKQAADDDELDGGLGDDIVTYLGRRSPVRVDLANPAPDGSKGERDRLVAIERLVGGDGNDVLAGDERPDFIIGGLGDDRLRGRGGNDVLQGIAGNDVLIGGEGRDTLAPQVLNSVSTQDPRGHRRLDCGPGDDSPVDDPKLGDLVDESCERVEISVSTNIFRLGLPLSGYDAPVLTHGSPCAPEPCQLPGRLLLVSKPGERKARPGTVIGVGEPTAPGDHAAVRLNSRGRTFLRDRGRIYAQYVSPTYGGRNEGFTMLLRAPG